MGNQATREIPKALGTFASTAAAWDARVQAGQDGQSMTGMVTTLGRPRGLEIITIGTNDTLASPGAQLDYFQSVLDRMGRSTVDRFARFFVMPQTGHGLSGTSDAVTGGGNRFPRCRFPIATISSVCCSTGWRTARCRACQFR